MDIYTSAQRLRRNGYGKVLRRWKQKKNNSNGTSSRTNLSMSYESGTVKSSKFHSRNFSFETKTKSTRCTLHVTPMPTWDSRRFRVLFRSCSRHAPRATLRNSEKESTPRWIRKHSGTSSRTTRASSTCEKQTTKKRFPLKESSTGKRSSKPSTKNRTCRIFFSRARSRKIRGSRKYSPGSPTKTALEAGRDADAFSWNGTRYERCARHAWRRRFSTRLPAPLRSEEGSKWDFAGPLLSRSSFTTRT